MKQKKKVRFSLKWRIFTIVVCAVILAMIAILTNVMPRFRSALLDRTEKSMLETARAYVQTIDYITEQSGGQMPKEILASVLSNASIMELKTGYIYTVDKNGIMLYHPTPEKIGASVENSVVLGLVADLAAGESPQPDIVTYDYHGIQKYAAYSLTKQQQILVVTADQSDVLEPVNKFFLGVILMFFIVLAICGGFGFLFAARIAKPLKRLTRLISKTGELDLTIGSSEELINRNDEIGIMSHAIVDMRANIRDMVNKLNQTSNQLEENASQLFTIAGEVNGNSSDNSATSEELAASMQETSASAEAIDTNVDDIKANTQKINEMTKSGELLADEIQKRAEKLSTSCNDANASAEKMYAEVKSTTEDAIEKSKSVEKINSLTNAIMEIATQTSLLSLNASIEAARAGDSGRGFAVVAGEIGTLATQSTATVNHITSIVGEVQEAVNNMSQCLEKMLDYLEKTVAKDYKEFAMVGKQYSSDADSFISSMYDIHSAISNLEETVNDISTAITGISQTIGEAATGVSDIAEKTSNTVALTNQTTEMAQESVNHANELRNIVGTFKLTK